MLDAARQLLSRATHPVSFSGAGLSAESGLSTFRDADGIWARYDPAVYASVQGFEADPHAITEWYRKRRIAFSDAAPNAAPLALASREMIHVTQNIDTLLETAGASTVIHLHGVIDRDRCHANCGHREPVDPADPPRLRPCPQCGEHMRPDVVWFGELLPDDAWTAAARAIERADCLIVVGTSAEVWPAAGLIHTAAHAGVPVVVVNPDPNASAAVATHTLIGTAAEVLPLLLG